ncbi:MAG: DNA repair protein RecO [Patescibacteria group bacterium]|jgi:DNA repair protein RecO
MSFKTEAFVLQAREWQKADRLYELFTPQEGVIHAILRSAAKPGNKLAGHMLPFGKVRIMIGRGRLDHLAGAAIIKDYSNIRTDLKIMSLAAAIVELLLKDKSSENKHLEYMQVEKIFDLLDDVNISFEKKLILVRVFLWKYLSLAGWQPELDTCLFCRHTIDGQQASQYLPGRGIICLEHKENSYLPINSELLVFLRLINTLDFEEFIKINISNKTKKEWLKVSQLFYQAVFDQPSQALKILPYA